MQTRQPGEDAVVFCHVTGEPFPQVQYSRSLHAHLHALPITAEKVTPGVLAPSLQVQWMKGEEPLRATDPRKYVTIGNGTELRVRHVDFTDTGVYFCQAKSGVGTTRDMSTLIVMRQDAQCE